MRSAGSVRSPTISWFTIGRFICAATIPWRGRSANTNCCIRRSRGYAPQPIFVAVPFVQPVLACGAHLKNTFCLGKERHAFMSHHIGDLENYETLDSFAEWH